MNKIILNFTAVVLFTAVSVSSFAQTPPAWSTDGNDISGPEWFGADDNSLIPLQFRHEANIANSYFEWFTTDGTTQPRMRLTRLGWLGLSTDDPEMMFHVHNGGILSTGAIGTNPDLEGGTRLMWIPDQFAFRAGRVELPFLIRKYFVFKQPVSVQRT